MVQNRGALGTDRAPRAGSFVGADALLNGTGIAETTNVLTIQYGMWYPQPENPIMPPWWGVVDIRDEDDVTRGQR